MGVDPITALALMVAVASVTTSVTAARKAGKTKDPSVAPIKSPLAAAEDEAPPDEKSQLQRPAP